MSALLPIAPTTRLEKRRALVTGAGRGIGLACAAALANAGADVVLVARSGQEIEDNARAIRETGGIASSAVLDVTDIERTTDWIRQQPPFDILVNNAGTNRPGLFLETRVEDYDAVFSLNVRAPFFLTKAVAGSLVASQRPGSIINMSSQMGHVGEARRSIYCASKHAVEGLTKALAAELAPHQIRVNSICPTFIETPMTRSFFEDSSFKAHVLSKIRIGRLGRVEDVMGAVVFLASDASALMTGSALMLDAGWTSTS